jgi:putative transposase
VKILKAFRYRVYPNEAQVARLARWDNALRFLWNLALEQRLMGMARPKGERLYLTAFDQINELTELRATLPWLADVPRHVCSQLLVELDKAWQRCFAKIDHAPHFKRKGGAAGSSFTESDPKIWRLGEAGVRFPKLGAIRAVLHRPLEGKSKTCTLKRDGDQWFVSITCEIEISDPVRRTEPVVAIDRGVANIVGDSDGNLVQAPRFYERTMKRLARAQRAVARRKKGSKNQIKARSRVACIHRMARRQREHFLHTISSRYAKSHGIVVLEKLNVAGMMRSNHASLSRGIADAGWSRFERMLDYKLTWSGGSLEHEVAAYSSQTCSACGHVDARSRVSQSVFRCTACGHIEHADLNAPKVLLQRFKTRANRSGLPVDGSASKGPGRSRKRVSLCVPRTDPEAFASKKRS